MNEKPISPRWNASTKLVIGLTLIALCLGLLIRFQSFLPPLLFALVMVYLLYPAAALLHQRLRLPWGAAVALVYLLLAAALLGLAALGGVELFHQGQNLLGWVENNLSRLPALAAQISTWRWQFGGLTLSLQGLDLPAATAQLVEAGRSLLGQTGLALGTVAGGALNLLGWTAFVFLLSYFLLAESGGLREEIVHLDLPGYTADLRRMEQELGQVWNAFLRGQFFLVGLAILVYSLVLSLLGVRYALGLALLAGLGRFLPYVGPAVLWVTLGLVTFLQPASWLGLSPLSYALLVFVLAWLIDAILDNLVSPRILADSLKVHPAAVMLAALMGANLLGLPGLLLAAPLLATAQLLLRYLLRKLFDLDPWEALPESPTPPPLRQQIRQFWQGLRQRLAGFQKR